MSKIKRIVTVGNKTITTEFSSVEDMIKFLEWERSLQEVPPTELKVDKKIIDDIFKKYNNPENPPRVDYPYDPHFRIGNGSGKVYRVGYW